MPEFTLEDDNFDDAFFEEIDKLATSLTQQPPHNQQHHHHQHQQPQHHHHQHQQPQQQQQQFFDSKLSSCITSALSSIPPRIPEPSIPGNATHSPPRELSQRNPCNFDSSTNTRSVCSPFSDDNREIQRLKSELSSVSKQLLDLKQECYELKKQKEKDQHLKFVHSNKKSRTCKSQESQERDTNGVLLRLEDVNVSADHVASRIGVEKKSTGVQTDSGDESLNPSTSGTTIVSGGYSRLRSIWSPLSSHRSHRNFVAKLLEACASDFCALFGHLGLDLSTDAPLPGEVMGLHSAEASWKSQLSSVLTKLADDMVHINAFVAVLLDLCRLENALVVRKSLHILHIALEHMLSFDRTCPKRDNVKVKRSDAVPILDSEVGKRGGVHDFSGDDASHASFITASNSICIAKSETLSFLSHVDWLHLFTSMCQIAVKLTEEFAREEAVSIMNIILMGTDPFSARAKFGGSLVFKAVALLLRKEAGFFCRKEAVHLLYLLLNCPNILATFCSSCKEDDSRTQSLNAVAISLACHEYRAVLEGLAECVVISEYGAKELNLCRNAIIVLSFLASSGQSGFECFLFHKLFKSQSPKEKGKEKASEQVEREGPKIEANFLGLVLQVLVAEIDAEALESCPASDISKERTLLMRESLRLLNRLTSHPAYSATVLQVLKRSGDMVSMAIDIATRLSKKSRRLLKSDSITRQMREYEVVDLACLFKKRVFTFLGESVSS